MTASLHRRTQLAAIAELRWRMFVNGLRSKRGKMELASRIIVTAAFAFGGLGGFVLATIAAWYCVSQGKAEMLPLVLWPIFFFWEVFPVMATAFTNNPDSAELLRFPLNYSSFFLIRLAYGLCDPASALGCLALLGVLLGVTIAHPILFPWALLALGTFALFNLILMQTVFAWLERWLAQRRTREIMGVLFILVMLSFQLIGPMMQRVEKKPRPEVRRAIQIITEVQAVLPPGLAADAIAQTSRSQFLIGFTSLLFLGALTAGVGSLLHIRLRAQFRGENLSEAAARLVVTQTQGLQVGWNLSGFSQPVAAVFEKEVRYLARSSSFAWEERGAGCHTSRTCLPERPTWPSRARLPTRSSSSPTSSSTASGATAPGCSSSTLRRQVSDKSCWGRTCCT
jgi:ABC-2 type transport system permease protein